MLAVHSAMDALRRSTSYSSDHPDMLRQPSAEDLDAAHQLVSSARGERISPPRTNETNGTSTSPSVYGIAPSASQPPAEDQQQDVLSESTERDAAGGFNQICRYVPVPAQLFCLGNVPQSFVIGRLIVSQQLWHDQDSSLASLTSRQHHLQCLWTVSEDA